MAFGSAETAKLTVDLSLTGNFQQGLQKSQAALTSFSGRMGKIKSSLGNTAKSIAKSTAVQVGLGVSLSNLAERAVSTAIGAFQEAVRKANEFGDAIQRVSKVTGDTVEETSKLVDTLDYFGINADAAVRVTGMAEKNLGALSQRSEEGAKKVADWNKTHGEAITAAKKLSLLYPKLAQFQKQYGLSLTDAKGKLLSFNELLLRSADYFNDKHIPAATKAAALAKIFGRNWQTLIPVLSQGSAKLREMEGDAIKLTKADIDNMAKFKEATREWDDTIGDLQITLGAKLLPELTALAKSASAFVSQNSDKIVDFFKNAYQAASKLAGIVGDVGRGLLGVWNMIPEPMRDLLVKGLVADRTIKFLFGFSPIKFATDALGGLVGKLFQRGSTPLNPLFVSNVGGLPVGGLPTGGLPGGIGGSILGDFRAALAAGGLGLAGGLTIAAFAPAALYGLTMAIIGGSEKAQENDRRGRQATAERRGIPGNVPTGIATSRGGGRPINPRRDNTNLDRPSTVGPAVAAAVEKARLIGEKQVTTLETLKGNMAADLADQTHAISIAGMDGVAASKEAGQQGATASLQGANTVRASVDNLNVSILGGLAAVVGAIHGIVISPTTISHTSTTINRYGPDGASRNSNGGNWGDPDRPR